MDKFIKYCVALLMIFFWAVVIVLLLYPIIAMLAYVLLGIVQEDQGRRAVLSIFMIVPAMIPAVIFTNVYDDIK